MFRCSARRIDQADLVIGRQVELRIIKAERAARGKTQPLDRWALARVELQRALAPPLPPTKVPYA